MLRFLLCLWSFTAATSELCAQGDAGTGSPPLVYDLVINGESFRVEANRFVKLESLEKPGTTYEVALRIALEQPLRLNTLQLVYDWPARVEDDRGQSRRTVRIRHELGFAMLITDLGGAVKAGSEQTLLEALWESTVRVLKAADATETTVSEPAKQQFGGAIGYGVVIRYRDKRGSRQTSLVYLMTAPGFAASCVAQYFDANQEAVLPRVNKTLNSIRAIE
ncbi:MAG: hypothetical protein ACYTG0_19925 [Planctomycetota bacterium]|jgi:hypothetical protein